MSTNASARTMAVTTRVERRSVPPILRSAVEQRGLRGGHHEHGPQRLRVRARQPRALAEIARQPDVFVKAVPHELAADALALADRHGQRVTLLPQQIDDLLEERRVPVDEEAAVLVARQLPPPAKHAPKPTVLVPASTRPPTRQSPCAAQ